VKGGKSIRTGQLVYLMFAAANRDPARFPDPDRLDVRRKLEGHLAFGLGPHFCLGAALARMEAGVAIAALLRRCDCRVWASCMRQAAGWAPSKSRWARLSR
jgi:cytochrome P450